MGNSDIQPEPLLRLPAHVLVVEDNYLIALDTEEMLAELGVARVRCAQSVEEALDLIAGEVPEFCLLDVNLGSEKSFEVAERLAALGVPFAFATGYGESDTFPDHFAAAAIVSKPYTLDTLRQALARA